MQQGKQKDVVIGRVQQLVASYLATVDAFTLPMAERECNNIIGFLMKNLQEPVDEPPKDQQEEKPSEDGQTPDNAD